MLPMHHSLYHKILSPPSYTVLQVEWLVQDEVLSRSRELVSEGEAVSPSLLQSVASHVQSSSGKYINCLFNHEVIKFVFGAQNSMHQFLQVSRKSVCKCMVALWWVFLGQINVVNLAI